MSRLTVSVVVITYKRPDFVETCVTRLLEQDDAADQIVVVDASPDDETRRRVTSLPGDVLYLRNPRGIGNMTSSRNVALMHVTGDVIAFLDDDAFVEPSYVCELRRAYEDPLIGLACSRTLNGQPGEALIGLDEIGRFSERTGFLTGNFAADAGRNIQIDHGIGATMSFRRSTLADLGGFREDYRGISGVREDTDVFLRARKLGFRAQFVNSAVAHHVAAPQARGERFDRRYQLAISRNHAILLANNFGLKPAMWARYVGKVVASIGQSPTRSVLHRAARLGIALAGTLQGVAIAMLRHGPSACEPRRTDAEAEEIRVRLRAR